MDQSDNKDPKVITSKAISSPNLQFGTPTSSDTGIIKIISLDDDEEIDGGGDQAVTSPNQETGSSPSEHYWKDRAPIPGNCCKFSTLRCTKFWAILNCVQLLPTWILVCVVNFGDLFDQDSKDDVTNTLAKCLEGGSAGARGTKLAIQIILLLVYTVGSVLFTLANFPFPQVLEWRFLFTKLYIWSLISFFLVFVMPVPFHLSLSQCYYLVSLLAWLQVFSELAACCAFLYFCWRVATLFQNYLEDITRTRAKTKKPSGSATPKFPPTPTTSKADMAE